MAKEFKNDDFLGRGWSFPPAFRKELQGVEMTEKETDIERSLHILLTTATGERLMQPKYGCNMEELVFESLNTTTKTLMKDKIQTAILYFEPRIDVTKIELNDTNQLEGEILIEIEYIVRATNSRFNFVFPYYINEGTELNLITTNQSPL
ncbi:MAG: GPW/gp25 family protein [Chitinophagaceae bacterium]